MKREREREGESEWNASSRVILKVKVKIRQNSGKRGERILRKKSCISVFLFIDAKRCV